MIRDIFKLGNPELYKISEEIGEITHPAADDGRRDNAGEGAAEAGKGGDEARVIERKGIVAE